MVKVVGHALWWVSVLSPYYFLVQTHTHTHTKRSLENHFFPGAGDSGELTTENSRWKCDKSLEKEMKIWFSLCWVFCIQSSILLITCQSATCTIRLINAPNNQNIAVRKWALTGSRMTYPLALGATQKKTGMV